jgi:hypothetical protein
MVRTGEVHGVAGFEQPFIGLPTMNACLSFRSTDKRRSKLGRPGRNVINGLVRLLEPYSGSGNFRGGSGGGLMASAETNAPGGIS